MRRLLIAFLIVTCVCAAFGAIAAYAVFFFGLNPFVAQLPTPTPTRLNAATPTPLVIATAPPQANDTLNQLTKIELPVNDSNSIAPRLKGIAPVPFATPTAPRTYKMGDTSTFWVSRDITGTYELVTATLSYSNTHTYIWVERGINATDSDIKKSGDFFENQIYPNDRRYLGSERVPGIDNDPHLFILVTRFRNAAGYITSSDEYPRTIRPYGNEHEMYYVNVNAASPGSTFFNEVGTHEFAHLIHENASSQESSWIREGLGDLTIRLVMSRTTELTFFTRDPNVQLTGFSGDARNLLPYYEGAYLFLAYGLDRFGIDYLRDIVSSGTRDIYSIQHALDLHVNGMRFDDLFADWVVANLVNNSQVANGKYSYKLDRPQINPRILSRLPATSTDSVHEYGTQYYELPATQGDLTVAFHGDTTVPVIPTTAHSGKYFWWGMRADLSDTSLTRSVDLTNVKNATLKFWTWYDIEDSFDYGYVEASGDNGKTWKTLKGTTTTNADPNGANYGNGLTGMSKAIATATSPEWIQEQFDLSAFAGQKVQLRFEYVTDDEYVGAGWAIDDLEIPEINWRDDAETNADWQAHGFARIDNVLPQKYILQVVEFGNDFKVERINLDATNSGTLTINGVGRNVTRIVVAVSGATPVTWESGSYQLTVSSKQ